MRCRIEEGKRLLTSRFFMILFAGALVVNFWLLANYSDQAPMAEAAAGLWERGVHSVTKENTEVIIAAFAGKEPPAAQISVRRAVEAVPLMADKIGAADFAEIFIEKLRLAGRTAQAVRNACAPMEGWLARDKENGTAFSVFVPCTSDFCSLFFRILPTACTVEAALAAVLFMLYCVNAPYDRRSKELVYATKTGRKLNRLQMESAFLVIVFFTAALWSITFLAAEGVFHMGKLWRVKVGSMMMLDSFYPVVCRFSISFGAYMLLQAAMSVCISLLFGMAAAGFVEKKHRTAEAFFKMGFVCTALAAAAEIFPRDSMLFFAIRFNPVEFIKKAGHYFAGGAGFLSVKYYEAAFILCWGVLLLAFLAVRYKRFLMEDI